MLWQLRLRLFSFHGVHNRQQLEWNQTASKSTLANFPPDWNNSFKTSPEIARRYRNDLWKVFLSLVTPRLRIFSGLPGAQRILFSRNTVQDLAVKDDTVLTSQSREIRLSRQDNGPPHSATRATMARLPVTATWSYFPTRAPATSFPLHEKRPTALSIRETSKNESLKMRVFLFKLRERKAAKSAENSIQPLRWKAIIEPIFLTVKVIRPQIRIYICTHTEELLYTDLIWKFI